MASDKKWNVKISSFVDFIIYIDMKLIDPGSEIDRLYIEDTSMVQVEYASQNGYNSHGWYNFG